MILLLIAILLLSCEKFTQLDPPVTQLISNTVFDNETTANAALGSLYSQSVTITGGSFNSPTSLGALNSDEMDNYSTSLSIQQIAGAHLIPSNSYSTALWSSCYQTIYYANSILEKSELSAVLSEKTKNQLKGEALFFRALMHFTLTDFFGRVPIILSTNYMENTLAKQSTATAVLDAVIADLEKSAPLLQSDYAISLNERIRANQFVAKALLARAQLYRGNYASAESTASEVIANSQYSLTALTDVFLKNSKETILAIKPLNAGQNTGEGNIFILTAKPTFLAFRTAFYNGFEAGDQRKTAWIGKVISSGIDYYYPNKYKTRITTATSEYSVLLRLAEIYLIRSEARARQNKLDLALADVDMIRSRAGLNKIAITNPSITKEALLDAILQERRSELFTEWSHRWSDLKRFGKNVQVLTPIKTGYQTTAELYPIPTTDINLNSNLTQNPGY